MKYYKVVRRQDDKLYSAILNMDKYMAEYKVGEYVKPKLENSKLFVFRHLELARSFLNSNYIDACPRSLEIWECEVTNPMRISSRLCYSEFSNTADIENDITLFWKNVVIKNDDIDIFRIPTKASKAFYVACAVAGSFAVDEVKLTKQI